MTTTSPATLDPYGKFPVTPAGGGTYAVKLGRDSALYASERIRYYIHVPVGFNDYSFNYRFACVLQDPDFGNTDSNTWSHKLYERPTFRVTAFDSATGSAIPCAIQNFIASPELVNIYGFKVSDTGYGVIYLPWTAGALPILGQGGKTIVLQVEALGCSAGGHWGYGYFDVVSCGSYKASVTYCNLDSGIVRFFGTGANQIYNWYKSDGTYIGQGAYIDAPVPPTPDYFYGVFTSGPAGCLDTIYTDTVSNFTLNTVPKTICVQFGTPLNLSTTVVGGLQNSSYAYTWSGALAGTTLSCTNCDNPVATPYDTTTYYVNVTDRVGCFRNDTVHVAQAPNAGPDLKVCPLGERPVQLHVAGPAGATFHWYDYGTSNPGQYLSCTDCQDPVSAPDPAVYTYTVGYDGCPVLDTIVVYHDTSNYIVAPQDLMVECRPGYRNLLSEAHGPNPKLNIPCGTSNPITCTTESTVTVGIPGTPPKVPKNSPFASNTIFTKYQFIIKKHDLLYSGFYSGTINSMAFYILNNTILSKAPLKYVFVSLACTDQTDFPDPATNSSFMASSALTPVVTLTDYALTAGAWNTIKFDQPYSWDTSKNLLVDLCIGPLTDTSATGLDIVSMEEGTAIQRYSNTANVCDNNAPVVYRYGQKPTVQFNYCETPDLPFEYTWRPGNNLNDSTVQNPQVYIPRSQNYAVYSVGRNGCQLRDSLHIYVPNHQLGVGPVDSFICAGQPAFLYASGGQAYHWYEVQGGAFVSASSLSCTDCATPIGHPMQTTQYAVIFDNEVGMGNSANPEYTTGCPDTMFITVNVRPLPVVVVPTADTLITIGQSVPLYVQGALHYTWSPAGSVSDPNAPMTIATPTVTTTYVATGYDQFNCSATDTVKVSVNYHTNILVPTGFTPDGDGRNDEFRVVNANVQRLLEFRVFNRWGQEVFSTTDIRKGWDGTWKGEPQPMGVYQYLIRVGYADQTIETYKGDVTLIR